MNKSMISFAILISLFSLAPAQGQKYCPYKLIRPGGCQPEPYGSEDCAEAITVFFKVSTTPTDCSCVNDPPSAKPGDSLCTCLVHC